MDQEYVKKAEETEADTSNISRPTIRHTKMRHFFFPAIVLASVLILALSISVFAVISISSRDINVEVNAVPNFSHIEKSPIISLFCEIKGDTDKIDTSSIKSYTIPTKLFFFSRRDMTDFACSVFYNEDKHVCQE